MSALGLLALARRGAGSCSALKATGCVSVARRRLRGRFQRGFASGGNAPLETVQTASTTSASASVGTGNKTTESFPGAKSAANSSSSEDRQQDKEDAEFPAEGEIPEEVMELFGTLRDEALRRLEEFAPIHLFSLCWAYSTARLLDEELHTKIIGAGLRLGWNRDKELAQKPRGSSSSSGSKSSRRRGPPVDVEGSSEDSLSAPAETQPDDGLSSQRSSSSSSSAQVWDKPSVLAEGDHWMALYKPPFWQVSVDSKEAAKVATATPFEDDDDGDMEEDSAEERPRLKLQSWLRQRYASTLPITSDPIEAFGLLHRLDAQTSGILLAAKSYMGAYWLRLQWCSYDVDKEYICLAHGWVDRGITEVHKRIRVDKKKAENSRRTVSTTCSISDSGKPSYTEVCTLAHLTRPATERGSDSTGEEPGSVGDEAEERYSLVALKLHTGRTHQIRVHMLSLGHPLVCDVKYSEKHFPADRSWCTRNFLHTYSLSFNDVPSDAVQRVRAEASGGVDAAAAHPDHRGSGDATGEQSTQQKVAHVLCPLPEDLREALAQLRPADEVSRSHHTAWLSGEASQLKSFEAYIAEFEDVRRGGASSPS